MFPQDTPNASVGTRKKKPGTIPIRAPCTVDRTPSQTGTQPTPSRSTLDGRRGPQQANNSQPSSNRRRYSRRSAGAEDPKATAAHIPHPQIPAACSHPAPNGPSQPPQTPVLPTMRTQPTIYHLHGTLHHAYTPPTRHNTGTARTSTTGDAHTHTSMRAQKAPVPPRHGPSTGTANRQRTHALFVRQRLPQTGLSCSPDHLVCLRAAHRLTHCPHRRDLDPDYRARPAASAARTPASHPGFLEPLTDALQDH